MNSFFHIKKLKKPGVLIALFIGIMVFLTTGAVGCTTAASYKGWSGVAVAGNNLYIGAQNGRLLGLDSSNPNSTIKDSNFPVVLNLATSGGLLGCGGGTISMYVYGTPVVVNNVIYFGGAGGLVFAYSADKGVQQWKYPQTGFIAPVVGGVVYDNGNLYFGDNDGKVYALNSQTGATVWSKPFVTGDKVWGTPVVSNGTLIVPSFDKKMYALNVADGSFKWSFATQGAIMNTPIIENGVAYFGSFDRYFYAVDIQTGNLVWKTREAAGKWFWANPVLVNNTIYAPNIDGNVYVINRTDGRTDAPIPLDYAISSSPVMVGSNLFVAAENGIIWIINTTDNSKKENKSFQKKNVYIYAPLTAGKVDELEAGSIITLNVLYVITNDNNLHVLNTDNKNPVSGWETISLSH